MEHTYAFPLIQHIDHVLPHIDDDCFRVIEKDSGHTFINYVKMGEDTFPQFRPESYPYDPWEQHNIDEWNHRAAIRRECRGLAFHTETGALVSRPFHKFFNVGENIGVDVACLDFTAKHWVCDKVDGSMLRPLLTSTGIRWGTKMGITDTALGAERWLYDNPRYGYLANYCISHGYTPIFEYVSPQNRIVVDYGVEPKMFLLAIRDTDTGIYKTPEAVARLAGGYDIPSAETYSSVSGDPTKYFDSIKIDESLDEGIVVQWEDGHRVKVKTETYSILHKVKEASRTERTLVTAIIDGKVDDLLPLLPVEERSKVQLYTARFWLRVAALTHDIEALYTDMRSEYETKKDFAIGTADSLTQLERGVVFGLWDGKVGLSESALNIVNNGLSSETKWAGMKENIAMATSFNNFNTQWETIGGTE